MVIKDIGVRKSKRKFEVKTLLTNRHSNKNIESIQWCRSWKSGLWV